MTKKFLRKLTFAIAIAMAGISATQMASAQTTIDLSTVSIGTYSDYEYDGATVTLTLDNGNYEITSNGTSTSNRIKVQSSITVNITLNSVEIDVSTTLNDCFDMTGATVNLTLQSGTTNTLKSGYNKAGIYVPTGAAPATAVL